MTQSSITNAAYVNDSARTAASSALEIWGGVEYTCNRVQDRYLDQMAFSGHADRLDDYRRIAELGIRTLRVGILWERHAENSAWPWQDERLARIRALGIRPIVSLVHHGSGPRTTSLLDPEFPEKLAAYAGSVAERYPWVESYTPVNEPHTTARFSGMYGLWFPHHTSRVSYIKALLHQLKGTVLSMEAIRRVRSDARLIPTDDVGNISGTEALRHIWELQNQRQWLPYDLLCGRVNAHHPLFEYLRGNVPEADIFWFQDHPCPPSVLGVNYYVTSDRYLDDRLELYPEGRRSAEGPFVDVEAVRVADGGIVGIGSVLQHAWRRYGIPIAITEVHLGGPVREQIRWLSESWAAAMEARRTGVNCVALTVWALLGSYYWNQLVTCENGHYEPGPFDVSDGVLRATDLASVVSQIAAGHEPSHPALGRSGWWRQPEAMLT